MSAARHEEMIAQYERYLAVGHHWALYVFLGWQHMATCAASYYLQAVAGVQSPWPYLVLWAAQLAVAMAATTLVNAWTRAEKSPLEQHVVRTWTVFILLCWNVAALNVLAGQPVFAFLPVLATLSSFAFLMLASLLSRRFVVAALVMCATGSLIARFPAHGFLIYGAGWLVVLEGLGVIFLRKRRRWLPARPASAPVARPSLRPERAPTA